MKMKSAMKVEIVVAMMNADLTPWKCGWMDGWMDGWADVRMDECMSGDDDNDD